MKHKKKKKHWEDKGVNVPPRNTRPAQVSEEHSVTDKDATSGLPAFDVPGTSAGRKSKFKRSKTKSISQANSLRGQEASSPTQKKDYWKVVLSQESAKHESKRSWKGKACNFASCHMTHDNTGQSAAKCDHNNSYRKERRTSQGSPSCTVTSQHSTSSNRETDQEERGNDAFFNSTYCDKMNLKMNRKHRTSFLMQTGLDLVREQAEFGMDSLPASTRVDQRDGSQPRRKAGRGPRERNRRHRNRSGPQCSAAPSSTSSTNQASTSDTLEIPGFYYDKEKKKYFRILPNHQRGASSGSVTSDTITFLRHEEKRFQDLSHLESSQRTSLSSIHHRTALTPSKNTCWLLGCLEAGMKPGASLRNVVSRNIAKGLKPRGKSLVKPEAPGPQHWLDKIEDARVMLVTDDCSRVFCVWTLKDSWAQRMQSIYIRSTRVTNESGDIDLNIAAAQPPFFPSMGKVTGVCWMPWSAHDDTYSHVLWTTTCFIGNKPSFACFRRVHDGVSENDRRAEEFNLSQRSLWCCAWNKHKRHFSVGTDNCSLVVDTATRRMWELHSRGSTVLAQLFSHQNGDSLYTGTKRGEVLAHDLRSQSTLPVYSLRHKIGLSHLYLTRDERHLVASDVGGKIKQWDLRQRRVVLEYRGHVNQYVKHRFAVDSTEDVIAAVGQDCYSRVWDMRNGELLRVVPPPYPAAVDAIPCVAYSSTLGGPGGQPGLLMATRNEFHVYSA